jgi:cytoskeletal protein CcmA (bactofilin family)
MHKNTILVLAFALSLFHRSLSSAAPLTEAHVTKIVNDVKLVDPAAGDREARLNDVVRDEIALTTGIKSRSELLFQDNTLTRLGPESYFTFKSGSREMTLQKGTMLLQVPKGLGGAKIHTASITAAITGTTIMMEYVPQKAIKVLVLEGSLRLSMNGRFGDSLLLTPGKMVIMSPNARRVPDPVTVDLKKVVQTSTLVNMHAKKGKQTSVDGAPVPSISKIEKEVERQQSSKDGHRLVDTNLVILGKGTNVVLGSDELISDLAVRTDVDKAEPVPAPPTALPTPTPTPIPAPTPNPNPPPSGTPPPPPPGVYLTDNTTTITTQPSTASITTQGVSYSGVIYKDLPTNGSPSGFLFAGPSSFDNEFDFDRFYAHQFNHSAVFVFDSLQLGGGIAFTLSRGTNNIAIVGNNGITNSAGAISLAGVNDVLFATKAGNISLDNAVSFGTTGDKPNLIQFYARGGDVNIGATFTLANTDLRFAAENNALFNASASIASKNLTITGLQSAQFDGNANVLFTFQINGGSIQIGGAVTAQRNFLFGTSATIDGSMNGGGLTANVSGDFLLGATGLLTNTGKVQITADGIAQFDGTINAPMADLTVSGVAALPNTPGILVNGSLTAKSFDFEPTGDFLLNSSGNLTSNGNLRINATNGAITLDGTLTTNDTTLTADNDVAVNHSISTHNLKVTGQNETIAAAVTANDVNLNAVNDVTVTSAGSFDSLGHHVSVTTGGNIDIAGAIMANDSDFHPTGSFDLENTGALNLAGHLKVDSGQIITIGGGVTARDADFQSDSDTDLANTGSFNLSGHLHINSAGTINLFGSASVTGDVQLTAGSSMTLDGAFNAINGAALNAAGDIEIGGNFQSASLNITSNTLTVNGSISATTVQLHLNSGLNLGAAGSTISAHSLSITVPTAFTFNTLDGTVTRFDPTNLTSLTINAQSIALDADFSLTNATGDLVATAGNIDATGHQLSGFDQISATGDLIAAGVTANKFTIGGTLTSPSVNAINAGTIVANALHSDTVTATHSVTVQSADLAPYSTSTVSITAPTISLPAGATLNGQNGDPLVSPTDAFNLTLATNNFTLNSALSLNGGDGDISVADAGGNGGQLNISGNNLTINAPISATTGLNSNSGMTGGIGGTVNLTAQNTITLNNKIEASSNDGNRRSSGSGGHINIKSNATGGTAINVTSSAQLLALLNAAAPGPGGSIKFTSAGGAINVSGTAQADRGTIEITNNGTTAGNITLTNATLAADTIKVGALATNGTLNIGGGTISADTLIKLYAGGSSGTVDFVDNVTLSGNSAKIIAADTVIINNGKIVTVLGPTAADVFTNHPHYTGFGGDATTTGTFGGKGATTHPLSGAPGY